MGDAPRRWRHHIDKSLRVYGLVPTRVDRCGYVRYGNAAPAAKLLPKKRLSKFCVKTRVAAASAANPTFGVCIYCPTSHTVNARAVTPKCVPTAFGKMFKCAIQAPVQHTVRQPQVLSLLRRHRRLIAEVRYMVKQHSLQIP